MMDTSTHPDEATASSSNFQGEASQLYDIENPHNNDVLCGRGVTTNRHPGNEKFRALVGLNKELYVTSTKRQKMSISRSIVEAVRAMNPPGRFLEKNTDNGLYSDIGDKKAIEKTSQALRDGAASLRKQLSEDLGDPDFLCAVFDMDGANAAAKDGLSASDKLSDLKSSSKKTVPIKKGHRRIKSTPNPISSYIAKHARNNKYPIEVSHGSGHPSEELNPDASSPLSQPESPETTRQRLELPDFMSSICSQMGGGSSSAQPRVWGQAPSFTIPSPAPIHPIDELRPTEQLPVPSFNHGQNHGRSSSFEHFSSWSLCETPPPAASDWSDHPDQDRSAAGAGQPSHPLFASGGSYTGNQQPPAPPQNQVPPASGTSSQPPFPMQPGGPIVWSAGLYQPPVAPRTGNGHNRPGHTRWRSSPNPFPRQDIQMFMPQHLNTGAGMNGAQAAAGITTAHQPPAVYSAPQQYAQYNAHPFMTGAPAVYMQPAPTASLGGAVTANSPPLAANTPPGAAGTSPVQSSSLLPLHPSSPPKDFNPPQSPSRPRPPSSERAVTGPNNSNSNLNYQSSSPTFEKRNVQKSDVFDLPSDQHSQGNGGGSVTSLNNATLNCLMVDTSAAIDERRSDHASDNAPVNSTPTITRDAAAAFHSFTTGEVDALKKDGHDTSLFTGGKKFQDEKMDFDCNPTDDFLLNAFPSMDHGDFSLELTDDIMRLPIAPVGPGETEMANETKAQ